MKATDRHILRFSCAAVFTLMLVFCVRSTEARFLTDDTQPGQQGPQSTQGTYQTPPPALQQTTQTQSKPQVNDAAMPPDSARAISAIFLSGEKNSVQITWDAPAAASDAFIVLRSSYLQNNPDAVLNSVPIKVIASDSLKMVLDRNLLPGRYYYAVIPKTKFDQRNIQLYPGENYTSNPIIVANDMALGDSRTVASLKAVTVDDRTVLLTWEPIGNFTGEYVIFRSRNPIDVPEKMNSAEPVARLISAKSRFLDTDAGPGRHYYAVACKTVDGILYSELKKDFNYTADAVFVGGIIGVRNIKAVKEGSDVVITWKSAVDTLNKNYYLIRSETRPTGKESIAGGYIVDSVQSALEKYTDRNVPPGKYFYLLAPANYKDDEDFTLTRGVNVTDPAITISSPRKKKKEPKQSDMQTSGGNGGPISADTDIIPNRNGSTLPAKKDATAKPGIDDPILSNLEEITLNDYSRSRQDDLSAPNPIAEIIPFDEIAPKDLPDIKAIAERKTERTTQGLTQSDINIPAPDPAREIKPHPLHSSARKSEAPAALKKQPDHQYAAPPVKQKKKKKIVKQVPVPDTESGTEPGFAQDADIDSAISKLFRNGNYKQTITELKRALPSAQGKEAASARLYIGRSYIELKRYRDAVGYLSDEDVIKYFPRESEFWRDYALEHMR